MNKLRRCVEPRLPAWWLAALSPPWPQRRQVSETWIRRERSLAVVGIEATPVLVGNFAAAPVRKWVVGTDPELVDGAGCSTLN